MALLEINAAFFYTFFIGLTFVSVYWSRWRRYFELRMKLPGPPALPVKGNCLQFTSNDVCRFFQRSKDINAQNGNDDSTLNNITTVVDTTTVRITKPWLLIDWIYKCG